MSLHINPLQSFSSCILYHESTNFDNVLMNIAKFLMSFSKPQVSFSFFLGQTLHTLHKRDQSKCKCFRLLSARIKIHQILVIFETTNQFFFKFGINLRYHEPQLLCTFLAEILYTFNKRSLTKQYKFGEISPDQSSLRFCTLMGSFCKNHIKFQLKKYRRVISHDIEE